MNKILLIVMLTLIAAFPAFAQSFISLETFAPTNEEFLLEAPESLVLTRSSGNNADASRFYKTITGGTYFFIVSEKKNSSALTGFLASIFRENKADGADVIISDIPGRKYSFADAEGFYQEILVISSKARVYIFHTVSETKDNPAVKRFYSSLRLNKTLPEATSTTEEKPKTDFTQNQDNKKTEMSPSPGSSSGSGSGAGSGNGIGSGTNQTSSPTSNNQTSALKILSKPRATYTDLARFCEISGDVPLRVTFLASGEIGSISPVSKLPFGLTTSAVNAASNIKFEPAKREGTTYTTTKTVIYTFILY